MKGAWAFLAVLLCACAGVRPLPEGMERRIVEAEGWAEPEASGQASARTRALADAQQRAVEAATGLRLVARTEVAGGVAVAQRISAESFGAIERYEILSQTMEGGSLRVLIRASVLAPRAPQAPAKPTVAVRLTENAAAGVRRALTEQGFLVLPEAGAAADWIVDGQARVAPLALSLAAGLRPCRARVTLQAFRRGTGAFLAQASREASALDIAQPLAEAKALEMAGFLSAELLARRLGGAAKR